MKSNTFSPLATSLRCCDVKRWHTVNVARQQSLAEHQWAVAMIAMALYGKHIRPNGTLEFALKALLHDVEEVNTGDVPSPAKEFTITEHAVSKEDQIIAVADAIEAYYFIINNGVGEHTRVTVVEDCYRRLLRRCNAAARVFGQDFLHTVDRVLVELDLPGRMF